MDSINSSDGCIVGRPEESDKWTDHSEKIYVVTKKWHQFDGT